MESGVDLPASGRDDHERMLDGTDLIPVRWNGGMMGLFGKKRIECPAGRWTTIISNLATGMPRSFTVAFTPRTGYEVSGSFEERKYLWIFPTRPRTGPLVPVMRFDRDWINGIYKVSVRPDTDLTAELK